MEPQNINTAIGFSADDKIGKHHPLLSHTINIKLILYILYVGSFSGLAQTSSQIAELYFTLHTHSIPAYAPFVGRSQAGFSFRNDFCTPELMYKSLEFHLAKDENAFHCIVSHDGHNHFGEIQIAAGYGRRFGQRLSISLMGIYLAQHAEHYRSQHSFTVDLSAHCQITPQWGVAIQLFNPLRMRYGITGTEVIPMAFSLHIHHHRNEKLLAFLQMKKILPGGFDIGGGLYYRPLSHLLLTGFCSIQQVGLGVFVPWRHLLIGVQTAWHYRISFSNNATLHYLFDTHHSAATNYGISR